MEIFCYALSASDNSEWRQRIEMEAEHFIDVSAWSVPDIAGKISADGIHIAVNLNGYTKVWLTSTTRCRAACAVSGRCSCVLVHCCPQQSTNPAALMPSPIFL